MNYQEKLIAIREFVDENFYDATDLVAALGISVEDIVKYMPDVLVANYSKFFDKYDYTEEETIENIDAYFGAGKAREDDEAEDY